MADVARVAVVSGAGGALGSATAARLRDHGWTVAGVELPRGLERVPDGVTRVACDLNRADEVARLPGAIAGLGRWQALVICSGGFAMGEAIDTEEGVLASQLDLNLLGPWRLARVAGRVMRDSGGGRMVVTLSRASVQVDAGTAAYSVTKAAAARLVEVLAVELRHAGINVNGVMPSVMDTPANRKAMGEEHASTWVPPARVAAVIEWLLHDDSADVSGALLPVYGRA